MSDFTARERLPFTRPTIDQETIDGVVEVLKSGWLASGPKVFAFEAALSTYFGGRVVRTMTSATAALEIALAIANVGPGDEVVTTPMSWCATSNVILRLGARPVFVDIDLYTRAMSMEQASHRVGPATRALLPVHFAGHPVDMEALYTLARFRNLRVIEDAAHAIGSSWGDRRIGSIGDLVCFSFHPNKNITTGEGGALVLDREDEIRFAEQYRFNGVTKNESGEVDVLFPGMKANLSDIAARIGLGQLPRLEEFNQRRRALVARYFQRWADKCPLVLPARGDAGHSWHMFAPLLPLDEITISRSEFIRRMDERGIAVGIHYPAIHLLRAYRELGWREGQFPNAERVGRETITLPLFPGMWMEDVDRVVDTVNEILEGAHR
jgi:dTDP-4-amino-4,6-dideoxygalactose transaminase